MEVMMIDSISKSQDLPQRRGDAEEKSKSNQSADYTDSTDLEYSICANLRNLWTFPFFSAPLRLRGENLSLVCSVILLILLLAGVSLAETPVELNNKAVQLMNHGDPDGALVYLLKAREISPTDESVQKNLASCYTLIGNRKMSEGKLADAISDFKSALYYSDDPNIKFYKGYAHYRLKEYDDAVYELEKAADSGLSSPDLFILIGKAFYDKGETVSAVIPFLIHK
ncbi:MAG: hypothetical protein Q7T53_08355 [Deltaproteobacteria bacterium]|nr:hypothetical protein [Deltaproteobacteria bacterium]